MKIVTMYVQNSDAPDTLTLMRLLNRLASADGFTGYMMQEVGYHENYRQFGIDLDMLSSVVSTYCSSRGIETAEKHSDGENWEQLTLF